MGHARASTPRPPLRACARSSRNAAVHAASARGSRQLAHGPPAPNSNIYGSYQLLSFVLSSNHSSLMFELQRVRHLFLSDCPREWTEHHSGELQLEKDEEHDLRDTLFVDTFHQCKHTLSLDFTHSARGRANSPHTRSFFL